MPADRARFRSVVTGARAGSATGERTAGADASETSRRLRKKLRALARPLSDLSPQAGRKGGEVTPRRPLCTRGEAPAAARLPYGWLASQMPCSVAAKLLRPCTNTVSQIEPLR